jgi:5'-3' exonuclease
METKSMIPGTSIEEMYDTSDMIALVDADKYKYIITYRIYKELKDTNDRKTIEDYVDNIINEINNTLKYKKLVFFFSGNSENTYRTFIGFTRKYKGNRNNKQDPYIYDGKFEDLKAIPDAFKKHGFVFKYDDIEADDLISMVSNSKTFVISDDKDLLQIVGLHYDFKSNQYHLIDENEAMLKLSYQLLIGDSTDNIEGIPGIGHVNGKMILDNISVPENYFPTVLTEYVKRFGIIEGYDRFCENWMLLKTRTNREGCYKEKYKELFHFINQF